MANPVPPRCLNFTLGLIMLPLLVNKEKSMKRSLILAAIWCFITHSANAYDTGAMTCDDIGQYAAGVMTDRGKGQNQDQALAAVASQTQWPGELEKSNLQAIVKMIHGRLGDQLYDDKAAYAVIKRDCDIGQRRRQQQ